MDPVVFVQYLSMSMSMSPANGAFYKQTDVTESALLYSGVPQSAD